MSPVIDVKGEVRKLANSKPVHAAAGAGALASEALRGLPGRLAKWRTDANVAELPRRASGYVTEARTRAVTSYDKLAGRGKRVLNGNGGTQGRSSTPAQRAQDGKASG